MLRDPRWSNVFTGWPSLITNQLGMRERLNLGARKPFQRCLNPSYDSKLVDLSKEAEDHKSHRALIFFLKAKKRTVISNRKKTKKNWSAKSHIDHAPSGNLEKPFENVMLSLLGNSKEQILKVDIWANVHAKCKYFQTWSKSALKENRICSEP